MATPTNTQKTYQTIGRREDLSDVIYNIAPTETPFITGIPRAKATGTLHEWQTDSLAAPAANAVREGNDSAAQAFTPTTRLTNQCQISDKSPRVTGTQLAVVTAGRNDELAYQVVKKTKELRRDMELDTLSNTVKASGDTTTARVSAGVESWLNSNTSHGAGGSAGNLGTSTRTDGTNRDLTESLLKTQLAAVWDGGGDPDCILVHSFLKQKISGFTGNATREINAQDRELVATIDLYHSDFGVLEIIPERFGTAESCLILQKDMWALAYLRSVALVKLSKTGDSEHRLINVEYCLESRQEAASGAVFDCNTS